MTRSDRPQEVLLRMFDEAAPWPSIRAAIRAVLKPEAAALSTPPPSDLTLCFSEGCTEPGHVSRVHEPSPADDLHREDARVLERLAEAMHNRAVSGNDGEAHAVGDVRPDGMIEWRNCIGAEDHTGEAAALAHEYARTDE